MNLENMNEKQIMEGSMRGDGKMETDWEKLGIANDFLFGKVMQDLELCKELLQRILPELEIDHIEYTQLQKAIRIDADAKSVRLDVYVKDQKESVYDIEMQTTDTRELPKRARYYQSMIDLQMIDKGQHYKHLKPGYIIFICPFDAFGKGLHRYTFKEICQEEKTLQLGDGSTKIFLNAKGKINDVSKELKAFLDYVAGEKTEDAFVEKLEEAIKKAKQNREWRHEYMTLLMRDQENIEKGMEKGMEKGIEKTLLLIQKLVEDGRSEEIPKIQQSKAYRQKLFQEYQIFDEP